MAHTGNSNAMKEAALLIHQARHHDRLAFVLRHFQIAHERRGANGPIAEPTANFVHAVIQRPAPFPRLGVAEHIQLHRLARRYKGGCVKVAQWYHPHRNILSDEQQRVLAEIMQTASEQQAQVLREMLLEYGSPKTRQTLQEGFNVQ